MAFIATTLSLKGCQIVAGGRSEGQTTGKQRKMISTLKGCEKQVAPFQGAILTRRLPEVFAELRPPATIAQTLRVEDGMIRFGVKNIWKFTVVRRRVSVPTKQFVFRSD